MNIWVRSFTTPSYLRSDILRVAEPFAKATYSWDMLQDIKDAKLNDARYPVVLHGFVTATRTKSGYIDYLNLVDPKLRTMIQVVVTKQPPAAQPTASASENAGKLNNDSLDAPASQADENIVENSHEVEDLDASPEAGPKITRMENQL